MRNNCFIQMKPHRYLLLTEKEHKEVTKEDPFQVTHRFRQRCMAYC